MHLEITSDTKGEIHVHGYDIEGQVTKDGGTVSIDFVADTAGVFEVERRNGQVFKVDLVLGLDTRRAATSDEFAEAAHIGRRAERDSIPHNPISNRSVIYFCPTITLPSSIVTKSTKADSC